MKKPSGQINNRAVLKNLNKLLKDLDRKISIRIGILGEDGTAKVPNSDLTYAELGAIHEFGATIEHPGGTPYVIGEDGLAKFVSKDAGADLPKTKPHQIVIPTRSFLRMPLMGPEGKKKLNNVLKENLFKDNDLNKIILEKDPKLLENIAQLLALAGEKVVQEAFESNGFGNWAPITTATKKHRKGSADNPPLDDTGGLRERITSKIEEKK